MSRAGAPPDAMSQVEPIGLLPRYFSAVSKRDTWSCDSVRASSYCGEHMFVNQSRASGETLGGASRAAGRALHIGDGGSAEPPSRVWIAVPE